MARFSFKNILRGAVLFFASAFLGCRNDGGGAGQASSTRSKGIDSAGAYYVQVHLNQSHFSLDIGKHLKDRMNAMDFSLPVSAQEYRSLHKGENIVDGFRKGSFWTEGSWGNTHLKVKDMPVIKSTADKSSYDVTLELKQSHFSLNLGKHIKDHFNEVKFKWEVPGDVYRNMRVGDDLIKDGFRAGSFWMKGSVGAWHLKVLSKDGISK